jgi:hypothetical protein
MKLPLLTLACLISFGLAIGTAHAKKLSKYGLRRCQLAGGVVQGDDCVCGDGSWADVENTSLQVEEIKCQIKAQALEDIEPKVASAVKALETINAAPKSGQCGPVSVSAPVSFDPDLVDSKTVLSCKPVSMNIVKGGAKVLRKAGIIKSDADSLIHCSVMWREQFRGQDAVCWEAALGFAKFNQKFRVEQIPCDRLSAGQPVEGCNVLKLAKAAHDYFSTDLGNEVTGSSFEMEGGCTRPQGYGPPEYVDNPFRESGLTVCNTYTKWVLQECGARVEAPKGAIGWTAIPRWRGPRDDIGWARLNPCR